MSIYSTLWILRFPRFGDFHTGCEWVDVMGQGVPAHPSISNVRSGPLIDVWQSREERFDVTAA
jgi:hypothetical protein